MIIFTEILVLHFCIQSMHCIPRHHSIDSKQKVVRSGRVREIKLLLTTFGESCVVFCLVLNSEYLIRLVHSRHQ